MLFIFPVLLSIFNLLFGLTKGRRFYLRGSLFIQLLYTILGISVLLFGILRPGIDSQKSALVFVFLLIFGIFEQLISILTNLIWVFKTRQETEAKVKFWRIFHFSLSFIFGSFFHSNVLLVIISCLTYFGLCVWDFFSLKYRDENVVLP